MFVNTGGGGKTQQPLQNQKNAVRHNNPYPHTQQQPYYEHHQSQLTFMAYPFCNFTPATHGSASGNNMAVNAGQGGRVLYHAPQQPQQVGLHNAEPTLHFFTKSAQLPGQPLHHVPQQHTPLNMITAVSHQQQPFLVPRNCFALTHTLLQQQARAPNLATAGAQHTVAAPSGSSMANQHHSSTARNAASTGPTAYVPPPYCRPPLLLGAASSNVPPQPASILTAATGVGQPPNLQAYTHISSGIYVAASSPVPMNIPPAGMGGGTASNSEHHTSTKERKYALTVVDPDTYEIVDLVDPQLKTQTTKITTVESVSIQTDNDRSSTASIASDPSEAAVETQSQSISVTDTDKNVIQMQNERDDYDLANKTTGLTTATTIVCVPDANTTTQSVHSGSESAKIHVSEDPNDTDADTNEHELDNGDEEVVVTTVENLSEISIDQLMPVTTSEEQTEEIPNINTVIEQIGESETDPSTETEVKSKDEICTISVEAPVIKKPEEKRKEVYQKTQPPVSSSAFNESKKGRKNQKGKRKDKPQKKSKQQSKSNNVSAQNAANNASAQVKDTGVGNKILESKSNISKDPPKKKELQAKCIRYTLEELKALANSPDSCKTPVVPCQKGDCISQLFVARHHHLSHQVGHSLNAINLQSYHHMNFNDSLDFVTGKRRVGGAAISRKHQEHHSNASSAAGNNNAGQQAASSGVGGGSGQLPNKMQVIHINLSLNEEIKLSECKNAWQPKFLSNNTTNKPQAESGKDAHDNIEETLKKVRGILNKLTSENFEVLLKEMTSVNINTHEKMKEVMLLIFEKTVSEPNFAPTYAKFSKVLFEEVKEESRNEFNSLLIKRLEKEFELNVNNADAKERKLEKLIDKLNDTKDQQEKIELQAELEHQEYQFRRRAWGTVRFIGEMYKLNALSANRVFLYVELLLKHGNEEKLEYMCKLLTTVGNLLESSDNNTRMDKIFSKIQAIVKDAKSHSNKRIKICSRVRFMMQDLIDLRLKNWGQTSSTQSSHVALRRRFPDDKSSNLSSGSSNTYERGVSHRVMFGNNNRHNQARSKESGAGGSSSGSYFMSKPKSQYLGQQNREQTIDVNKLNFSRGDDSTKLGNSTIHMWRTMPSRQTNQSNELQQSDRNSATSTQLNTTHQKQRQQEKSLDIKSVDSDSDIQAILDSCTRDDSQKLVNHLMEEYLDCITSRSSRWQEEVLSIWQKINNDQQICLVHHILTDYLHSYVTDIERNACANIFVYLMSCSAFNKSIFTRAYEQFAVDFPEILLMDVPNGWTYVFQFLGPLLHKRLLTFKDIWHKDWRSDELFTERFVNALVVYFTREFGANYMRDLWNKEFKLGRGHLFKSDQQEWQQFVTSNKLQFLYDSKVKPEIAPSTTNSDSSTEMHQHMQRVEVLLSSPNDPNLALDYINTNVNINSCFLKSLTRYLCCNYATTTTASSSSTNKNSSTCSNTNSSNNVRNVKNSTLSNNNNNNNSKYAQLNADAFRNTCLPLLRLCLDAHEEYELICLASVVDAIQQDYDTDTAEKLICGIFDILYDCEVVAKESFEKWYKERQQQSKKPTLSPKNRMKQPLSSSLQAYMQKLLLTN